MRKIENFSYRRFRCLFFQFHFYVHECGIFVPPNVIVKGCLIPYIVVHGRMDLQIGHETSRRNEKLQRLMNAETHLTVTSTRFMLYLTLTLTLILFIMLYKDTFFSPWMFHIHIPQMVNFQLNANDHIIGVLDLDRKYVTWKIVTK